MFQRMFQCVVRFVKEMYTDYLVPSFPMGRLLSDRNNDLRLL